MMDTTELRATMLQAILAQGVGMDQAIRDAEAAVAYVLSGPAREEPTAFPKRGPARTNMILDMWAAGSSMRDIAERFGMARSGVNSAITKARCADDPRAVLRKSITEQDRAERAARMRAVGLRGRSA